VRAIVISVQGQAVSYPMLRQPITCQPNQTICAVTQSHYRADSISRAKGSKQTRSKIIAEMPIATLS
jgi:hypothetical protein